MQISAYTAATSLKDGDVFITDGVDGTKKITKNTLIYDLYNQIPEMHNAIFRGKNLGSTMTPQQKAAVSGGTFNDLWLGDYWSAGGNTWRIAGFDIYRRAWTGGVGPHIILFPDDGVTSNVKFHTATLTNGNAKNATIYPQLTTIGNNVTSQLGCVLKNTPMYTQMFNSAGQITGEDGPNGSVHLPTSMQLFGTKTYIPVTDNIAGKGATPQNTQLPLFMLSPYYTTPKTKKYWTWDLLNGDVGVVVDENGSARGSAIIQEAASIRPLVVVGG